MQEVKETGDFFKNRAQVPSKCFYVEDQVILVVKNLKLGEIFSYTSLS